MNLKENDIQPTEIEFACIDLLSRQGHILDSVTRSARTNQYEMASAAVDVVSCFLDFSEAHCNDHDAVNLALKVAAVGEIASECQQAFDQSSKWFRANTKAKLEGRMLYNRLGEATFDFAEQQLALCDKMFPDDSPYQELFRETGESLLKELAARW